MSAVSKSSNRDLLPTFDSTLSDSALEDRVSANASGVSWSAVLAGAAGAAALSLILLILGVGLGLSSVSPWAQAGVSAATFGISTILWVTFTQLAASGMGGYLAGRLRTRWVSVHTDEVYFRDTAHGFLAWAVASLATAALLSSTIGSIVGAGVQAGATAASGAVAATTAAAGRGAAVVAADATKNGGDSSQVGYFVDSMFRADVGNASAPHAPGATATENAPPAADASAGALPAPDTSAPPAPEVVRIFAANAGADSLPADDVRYLGQLVAHRTGMSQQDAEKRVTDTYARMQAKVREAKDEAKAAADSARKASSYAALWLFISLLIGAFVASLAATIGGRQRDL
jgi:hypothetical protein